MTTSTITEDLPREGQKLENSPVEFNKLIERVKTKQITVGVIGLGYVGLPLSLVFSASAVNCIGFDINDEIVAKIQSGKSHLDHMSNNQLEEVLGKNLFAATTDLERIRECDALIICVPTPLNEHLEPDLSYIEKTCVSIAPYLKPHALVCLESTTWPGTTEQIVIPLLEKHGLLKMGSDLYVAFSPEREDPGNKSYSTKTIPKLVGGCDEKSLTLAKEVYSLCIDHVVPLSHAKIAEASKLFENVFRSVNIALVNELKVIFDKMGIDVWEVINAAATKPFGFMPFYPGPGLGGHCIPIDPYYLTWKAREFGISTRFIELSGEINRSMPDWVVGKIQDTLNNFEKPLKGSKILILGLAYKPNVGDLRESPSLKLISLLERKGAIVDYYDPYIPELHKTREYPELAGHQSQKPSSKFDCFVLSTAHDEFSAEEILSLGKPIIDTRNFFPDHALVYKA
jgi:UDP-N-acetyl-D-glucosamine dehydrogenase